MEFSENTRVKIPALVHATRLGYKYLSLKEHKNEIDEETNIFKNIFKESINRINNLELSDDNITKLINELSFSLANVAARSSEYIFSISFDSLPLFFVFQVR